MKRHLVIIASGLLLLFAGCGCKSKPETAPAQPSAAAPAAPAAAPAVAPVAAAPQQPAAAAAPDPMAARAGEPEEGCGAHAGEGVKFPETTTRMDGETAVILAGAPLDGVPPAPVQQVMTHAAEFAGKRVHLEGKITAMCMHSRSWFAVEDPQSEGAFVRVIAAPQFLVPQGSIGKRVRVEGVVEEQEVKAGAARHFAEDHKLGDPNTVPESGTVKTVVVRALGAEIY